MITQLLVLLTIFIVAGLLVAMLESKNRWIRGLGHIIGGIPAFLFIYLPIRLLPGFVVVLLFALIEKIATGDVGLFKTASWVAWTVVIASGFWFILKDLMEWSHKRSSNE